MSLKETLNNLIRDKKYLSYGEMVEICLKEGYKISNGERRLRKSESPSVERIEAISLRGTKYIKGYQWKNAEFKKAEEPLPLKVEPSLF